MNPELRQKNWLWKLTWPFAHNNYTALGNTLYHPKGLMPPSHVIAHEKIHMRQQKQVGVWKFILLYIFGFPLFYNRYRYKWEMEAYTAGSGITKESARKILASYKYGWLKNK